MSSDPEKDNFEDEWVMVPGNDASQPIDLQKLKSVNDVFKRHLESGLSSSVEDVTSLAQNVIHFNDVLISLLSLQVNADGTSIKLPEDSKRQGVASEDLSTNSSLDFNGGGGGGGGFGGKIDLDDGCGSHAGRQNDTKDHEQNDEPRVDLRNDENKGQTLKISNIPSNMSLDLQFVASKP
ncbi:CYFA0S07e02989g1_1 [Cyberlindnera fabianii]|uniref:CYFA0S07e02989g1_1 n=1 Tax=Cyberlindnera fabianii TaxID=36022 RepID=A0A061AV82_CYBFA|nr:CYFA0S07e02989g1_1 [Cyberlindnera fabianii]